MSEPVDKLMVKIIQDLDQKESAELLGRFVVHLKNDQILNQCLYDMDSRDFTVLRKAVLDILGEF